MILETDDVVFAQIFAALHLDHDQFQDSGVFEAMLMPGGNMGNQRRIGVLLQTTIIFLLGPPEGLK